MLWLCPVSVTWRLGDVQRYTLQPVFKPAVHRCHIRHFSKPSSVVYELFIYAQVDTSLTHSLTTVVSISSSTVTSSSSQLALHHHLPSSCSITHTHTHTRTPRTLQRPQYSEAVLRVCGPPLPLFKSLSPCRSKWRFPRRYFNRSICCCISRIAGAS